MLKQALFGIAVAALLVPGMPATAQVAPAVAPATNPATDFASAIAAAKAAMMANPDEALRLAQAAANQVATEQSAGSEAYLIQLATAHWLQAEAMIRLNHPREAQPIIDKALDVVARVQPGSKLYGDLLMTRASLAGVMGEVRVGLQMYQAAHNVYQAIGEDRGRAIALQNIGSIYSDARDNERVLHYYAQSAEAYAGDPSLNISSHNNRGFAFLDMAKYAEAEAEFREALELARQQNSAILQVRIMTNVALAQLGGGKLDEADATAFAALNMATASAEGWQPFLWGVRAKVAFAQHNLAAAATFIGRTFSATDLDTTTMPYREFHEAAYKIYQALGNPTAALNHLEAFKRLDDEARNVAASTNSALAAAQFDFANQELSIAKLKAGQLERDMALAAWNSRFLNSLLAAAGGLLVISFGALAWIQRSRSQVSQANAKLSVVNGDLEKALQARTRFLAMTSHEMRTPLNGILGMTQVLVADPAVQGELRQRIDLVHSAGNAMKALVDDILDVAKIESGRLELEHREFDLRTLLQSVAQLWRAEAAEKQVSLVVDLAGCAGLVRGDEQRLRQLAYNLVSNAMKFTSTGEVRLSARTQADDDGHGRLTLEVRDTGIGIPTDKLGVIFETFQQVDASVSRQFGGTGLGLAICRSIARAMGGDISVASEIGKGSAFTVDVQLDIRGSAGEAGEDMRATGARSLAVVLGNPLTQAVLKAKLADQFDTISFHDILPETVALAGIGHVLLDAECVGGTAETLQAALEAIQSVCPAPRVTTLLPAGAPPELLDLAGRLSGQVLVRPVSVAQLVGTLIAVDDLAAPARLAS